MTKEEIKEKYFHKDEKVLWSGKAENINMFTKHDFVLVPLTVILSAFILVYVYSAFMLMIKGESASFALSGITCLLVVFYLAAGRLWYRQKKLLKNIYFVTDRRVFVFNTFRDKVLCDIPLELAEPYEQGKNVFLSHKNISGDIACALGLDLFLHNIIQETPAFYSIENTNEVLKIITNAKKNRKADTNDTNFI